MARLVLVAASPHEHSLILVIRVPVDLFYDARYSHTKMTNPDFVRLAQAMNVHAIRCTSAEDLPAKMKEFLEYDNSKPVLLECVVEKNEHVFPMASSYFTYSLVDISHTPARSLLVKLFTSNLSIPLFGNQRRHEGVSDDICFKPDPIAASSSAMYHHKKVQRGFYYACLCLLMGYLFSSSGSSIFCFATPS